MSLWKQNEWFEMKTVMFLGSEQLLELRKCWEGNIYVAELSKAERPACVLRFVLESRNVGVSSQKTFIFGN